MSSILSETIRRATVNANYNFEKIITEVADGLKRCGFFDQTEWKNMLEQCFGRTRLGLTSQEIQIYSSVLSDSSYDAVFADGLSAESTPYVVGASERTSRMTRNKRSSTTIGDGTPQDTRKKIKKGTVTSVKVANILVDMKNTDWGKVVPHLKLPDTTTPNVCSNMNVTSPTIGELNQIEATPRNTISKRRNCVFIPSTKQATTSQAAGPSKQAAPSVSKAPPVADNSKTPDVMPTVSESNAVVDTNIPVRRMTRRQTQLKAAYSGKAVGSTTDRRKTNIFQRTSVLFTMIDALPFRRILGTYNIFVADVNEKYDYVVAEKICRSAKFLSAVVSGKPIISIEWIHALKDQKVWLEPLKYLLKDDDGEQEYNFKLATTLQMATNKRLFEKYSILVTPNTSISADMLKGVIFSGGGKFLKTTLVPRKGDEIICVSDEVDKKLWPKLKNKYPTLKRIISLDGFAKMIFQYTYDVDPDDVLHDF